MKVAAWQAQVRDDARVALRDPRRRYRKGQFYEELGWMPGGLDTLARPAVAILGTGRSCGAED